MGVGTCRGMSVVLAQTHGSCRVPCADFRIPIPRCFSIWGKGWTLAEGKAEKKYNPENINESAGENQGLFLVSQSHYSGKTKHFIKEEPVCRMITVS
jgi:hypothetical protein